MHCWNKMNWSRKFMDGFSRSTITNLTCVFALEASTKSWKLQRFIVQKSRIDQRKLMKGFSVAVHGFGMSFCTRRVNQLVEDEWMHFWKKINWPEKIHGRVFKVSDYRCIMRSCTWRINQLVVANKIHFRCKIRINREKLMKGFWDCRSQIWHAFLHSSCPHTGRG